MNCIIILVYILKLFIIIKKRFKSVIKKIGLNQWTLINFSKLCLKNTSNIYFFSFPVFILLCILPWRISRQLSNYYKLSTKNCAMWAYRELSWASYFWRVWFWKIRNAICARFGSLIFLYIYIHIYHETSVLKFHIQHWSHHCYLLVTGVLWKFVFTLEIKFSSELYF